MFRTYNCVFVGSETVDWLLETQQAPDRETAVILMNILLKNQVFHHVNDEHPFKDENLYYRFRKDDGTFRWHEDVALVLRGQRLYNRLISEESSIIGTRKELGVEYPCSFQGCKLVDWLLTNKEAVSREAAIKEGRRLLENDIIRHVSDSHHFKDEYYLYQFKSDFGYKRQLLDLIRPRQRLPNCPSSPAHKSTATQNIPTGSIAERSDSGYHSAEKSSADSYISDSFPLEAQFGSMEISPKVNNVQITSYSDLLMRKATVEELEDPNSPFIKKHIRIASDPVGFGFVIRGDGPVFVKTVDPTGPAAKAGLKVGHYIYKVNDQPVLHMNHRHLANVILDSIGYMDLVVMEHAQDTRRN
jgi:hypothetical protein